MFQNKGGDGEGGGYMMVGIDKLDGFDHADLMIDGTAMVLAILQQVDPSTWFLTQIENSVLPPLTNPDQTKGYPNNTLLTCSCSL